MITLFDAVLRLARELVLVRDGVVTDSTATTLTDSLLNFPTDTFRGGTIFILGAAVPVGGIMGTTADIAYRKITQQNGATFTFEALGGVPAAGNLYAAADNDIPLDALVAAVNSALRPVIIPGEDATLTTVASQEEYTLPPDIYYAPAITNLISHIYKVEIATSLTSPYHYVEHFHWAEDNGKLRFAGGFTAPTTGYKICLTYRSTHGDLKLVTDEVPAYADVDLLHWTAVQHAAKYGQRVHFNDPKRDWAGKIQEAEVRIQRLDNRQPRPQKSPRLSDW